MHDFSHKIYFYCWKKLKKHVISPKIDLITCYLWHHISQSSQLTITKLVSKSARGMNEQLLKTSGADVLSSRKKNSEKPNPTPNPLVRPRVQSQDLVSTNFDIKDILFGHFCSDDDDSILVNYIILESKYLIFRSKLSRSPLSTSLLCAKCIKKTYIKK